MLILISITLSQTPVYGARPWIRAGASHSVPVYLLVFADTHFVYPHRDGQAELGGLDNDMVYLPAAS